MDRRNFITVGLAVLSAGTVEPLATASAQPIEYSQHGRISPLTPMLYGSPRKTTDLQAWFRSMQQWGVRQWMSFAVPLPTYWRGDGPPSKSVAFLQDTWPGFTPYLDAVALASQQEAMHQVASLCDAHGMEFWYVLPFPIFPTQDMAVVQTLVPDLFQSGRLNLYDSRLPELLKTTVRALKSALPNLNGISLWMAEGMGGAGDVIGDNLEHNSRWEPPILQALDEVTHELAMRGNVSCHHYLQTRRTHRNVYEMMARFPRLVIMDDITWPEEDLLHPFLGYLPPQDRALLFHKNPVALNYLLDTEYVGEGVLPSVYPRWWKHNVGEAARSGVEIAMGRVFFWDDGRSDLNFNRLNAHIFTHLCHHPELDAHVALHNAAQEMFGADIHPRLVDILWQTEPVVKQVIGINGIDSLNHSRFPSAAYIDVLYVSMDNCMKAVDDLFSTPGTPLYPALTDDLNNFKQWRWQNRTVSRPAEKELAIKRTAIQWIESVLPEVRTHAAALAPQHRDLFVDGYEILLALARGMELFVQVAAVHYQWAHAKKINDGAARLKFLDLTQRMHTLAAQMPENPFGYKQQMLQFAEFLETKLPRIKL